MSKVSYEELHEAFVRRGEYCQNLIEQRDVLLEQVKDHLDGIGERFCRSDVQGDVEAG